MSGDLRDHVAAELESMAVPGGDLDKNSSRSTWSMYGDARSRLTVWQEISDRFLAMQTRVARDGRSAVLTAGAPGAGKTTALSGALGDAFSGFRRIDPDVLKDLLLGQAVKDGIYEHLLRRQLADGLPLFPRELSGLVHEESVRLAGRIRRQCMRRGENVILEGTLSWTEMIDVHLTEVAEFGYDAIEVVFADIPADLAHERVLLRWWEGRNQSGAVLGGRWMPAAAVLNCWDRDGRSVCQQNALELYRRASRMEGLEIHYREVGGDATATEVPIRLHAVDPSSRDEETG